MSTAKFKIIPFVNYTTKYLGKLDGNVIPVVALLKVYNEVVVADVLYCKQLVNIENNQNNILDKVYQAVDIDLIQSNVDKELTYKEYNALLRGVFKGETFVRHKIDLRYVLCALDRGLIVQLVDASDENWSIATQEDEQLLTRAKEAEMWCDGLVLENPLQEFIANPTLPSVQQTRQKLLSFNWGVSISKFIDVLEYNLINLPHLKSNTKYFKISEELEPNEPKVPFYK